MARKKTIITTDREIYNKLNMLHFSNEILIKDSRYLQINKILNTLNKERENLIKEKIGEYILIKKKQPLNFDVYFRKKKKKH